MRLSNTTWRTWVSVAAVAAVSSFGVLGLAVSAAGDCAAKCIFVEAFAHKADPTPQVPNPPVLVYDVVEPAMKEFEHCFRIWVTDGGGDNLANDETYQVWYKKRSDGSHNCQPNSGIPAEGIIGESTWGPATAILCYSECIEIQEE